MENITPRKATGPRIHKINMDLKGLASHYELMAKTSERYKTLQDEARVNEENKRDRLVAKKLREAAKILREARDLALNKRRA
jgi:hypothetical protein